MKGNCLELEAFKMAREQAQSKVYTPPELFKIEEKIRSQKKKPVYRCQGGSIHKSISTSRLNTRKNSK